MKMLSEAESDFIFKIDCNFPYADRDKCLSLIREAVALSPRAAFYVVHELCRIPRYQEIKIPAPILIELLDELDKRFDHPIKDLIFTTARNMINGELQNAQHVAEKMEQVRPYPGEAAALNILYYSCNDNERTLEPVMENIWREWRVSN